MASRELNIIIKAQNLAGAAIKGVKGEIKSLKKDIGRGLSKAGANIEKGIGIGVAAAAGGLAYAVKQAGDFEASLNTINTVAGLSQDQLTAVGSAIRKMARDSGTPLEDLTSAYYDLVSAGVSASDAQNVLTQANTLAIGGLGTTAETVDLLTTAINSYGGDASKAKEYTDQFAVAIANGKVTAADLAANFADVGPLAAAMGVGIDQISASIGNMTAKGTHAPEAFTQIRAAMVALQRQTPQLKKVMKSLGIENIQTELDSKGLAGTWDELAARAKELGIPLIKLTGRVEGQQYVLQNTGDALDDYNKNLNDVKGASAGAGEAAQQMAERQKGLNFQLGKLKANAKDAAITLGEAIIPKILPLFEQANAWLSSHQPQIKEFAQNVAEGVGKAVEWAQKLDWQGIGRSLEMAAGFAKGLIETFLGMPDWVKQAVITGWGLNKLTGGAVGSIIGDLGKGLIKGVLGMNAGVVNIKAGVVNGGPGGGPGGTPVAGPGGKSTLGKVLDFASKAIVVGFVADLAQQTHPMVQQAAEDVHNAVFSAIPKLGVEELEWPFGPKNTPTILPEVFGGNGLLGGNAPTPNAPLAPVAGTSGSKPVPVADPILAGIEKRNASEYNRTITSNLAKQSTKITAGITAHAASDRADSQREQARIDGVRAASQRGFAANLARLDGVRRATANVPPALSRIEGVERGNAGRLQTIANKKSSVVVNLTAISQISIRALAGNLATNTYTTVTGRRGGALV